jgi:transcriptional regulator with XRE-family HTH domain
VPFRPDLLKALRETKSLSQEALAKMAEISHSAIAKCESGKSTPNSETLDRLAVALDATIDYFYGRGPEKLDPATAAASMSLDVFLRDKNFTNVQGERCRRVLSHPRAPKTSAAWRALAEMMELAAPQKVASLALVPGKLSKPKPKHRSLASTRNTLES